MFSKVAPAPVLSQPVPDQVVVPALARARARALELAPAMARVRPAGTVVVPGPAMAPPVQVMVPPTVTGPAPLKVPPDRVKVAGLRGTPSARSSCPAERLRSVVVTVAPV